MKVDARGLLCIMNELGQVVAWWSGTGSLWIIAKQLAAFNELCKSNGQVSNKYMDTQLPII